MSLRQVIRQEVKSRTEFIVGTMLSSPEYAAFDDSLNPVWTATVEVGGDFPLSRVPVKSVNGSRSYASRGATVLLRRNAQGRYEVVAPGDRRSSFRTRKKYTFGNSTPIESTVFGFSVRVEAFEFYQGTGAPNSLWNDGVTPFPKETIIDANGDPVT